MMVGEKPACPYCSCAESHVVDTRGTLRRRECESCGSRFSTDEIVRPAWHTRQPRHRTPHWLRQPTLLA